MTLGITPSFIQANGLMRRSEIRVVLGEHTPVFFESLPHAGEALI